MRFIFASVYNCSLWSRVRGCSMREWAKLYRWENQPFTRSPGATGWAPLWQRRQFRFVQLPCSKRRRRNSTLRWSANDGNVRSLSFTWNHTITVDRLHQIRSEFLSAWTSRWCVHTVRCNRARDSQNSRKSLNKLWNSDNVINESHTWDSEGERPVSKDAHPLSDNGKSHKSNDQRRRVREALLLLCVCVIPISSRTNWAKVLFKLMTMSWLKHLHHVILAPSSRSNYICGIVSTIFGLGNIFKQHP